ncbi:MAG: class I SAM-dependent methyltransferase [Hyphomicrobiales bacterium]
MHMDVIGLREFYARPLGMMVRRLIGHRLRARWRDVAGMSVFGLGYAVPYLGAFRGDALRVGALMPAPQGVIVWPEEGQRCAALVDDTDLPLPNACVDRLVIVHALESTEAARAMLREAWRVLAPEGRVMIVVPNRRSIWSRLDSTPFGHGRPFSRGQLAGLLREAMFTPTDWTQALYMPPVEWPLLLRSAIAIERIGAVLWPAFSGVIMVEATKQIYGAIERERAPARRRLMPVPEVATARGSLGMRPFSGEVRARATAGIPPARR